MRGVLQARVLDEVTREWVLALYTERGDYLLAVNDNMRLADLRRWIGMHLLVGARPRDRATSHLLALLERALCSPRCRVRIPANGWLQRSEWTWMELLLQMSEETYARRNT